MGEVIVTRGLTKIYPGGILAVDEVSFSVAAGEIFGFLGPNGAGKTTTIHMLITLVRPTGGDATVCGHDVVKEPDRVRSNIGYVSQDIAVDETLTGRQNLRLRGHLYHLARAELDARTKETLEMVDLAARADDPVSTYSGGMRKRLDIAEGLIHRPKVLFLDEPTLGLDIQTRRRIWEYIRKLRDEEKITIFLTTHYMDEADELCDRLAIIDRGKIVATGSPAELKRSIGGDLVSISLDPRGRAEGPVAQALASLPCVQKVSAKDHGIQLVVPSAEHDAPRVFERLGELGAPVESISFKKPSLDDVFLHYTGRALREDEGASAFWRMSRAIRRVRA